MMFPRPRDGYVFLITVLVIGAIASSTTITLVLLGLASEASGLTVTQSAQAYENAQTCAERALRLLRADLSYNGGETFSLTTGNCTLQPVGGSGNDDRVICAQGNNANVTRRVQVWVRTLFPTVKVASWREVSDFSCTGSGSFLLSISEAVAL